MADAPHCSSDSQPFCAASSSKEDRNTAVTNLEIFELFKKHKNSNKTSAIQEYRFNFMPENSEDVQDLAIYNKLKAVHDSTLLLRGKKREAYLNKDFNHPRSRAQYISDTKKDSPRKKELRKEVHTLKKENTHLKRKYGESIGELERLDRENEQLADNYETTLSQLGGLEMKYSQVLTKLFEEHNLEKDKKTELQKQMTLIQAEYEETKKSLVEVETELNQSSVKYLNLKIKRKEEANKKNKAKIRKLSKDISNINQKHQKEMSEKEKEKEQEKAKTEEKLKNKDNEIKSLKEEKARLRQKIYNQNKALKREAESFEKLKAEVAQEQNEIELKVKEIKIKQKELDYLQTVLDSEQIQTFHDGKYNDNIRLCIMELLSMNVSVNKVNEVIQTVIKRLTDKVIDRLPSKGLRCQLLSEARHLSDIQVGQAMFQNLDLNSVLGNTLHGDGTTKYHRHFQNFQVSSTDGKTLSAGLIETVNQDAESILQCWKERVSEIAKAVSGCNASDTSVNENVDLLLASIKNTMSDQCATNGLFNQLMSDLRSEIIPKVVKNWETLGEESRSKLTDMGNFFCKVHPLLSFAEEANKALLQFENSVLDGKSKFALPVSGESGTFRLVRTACAAFQKRGNQQAGVSEDFKSYLSELDLSLFLIQLEGNRFNVGFYNGGAVYHHQQHITNFIENKHKQNRLLSAVVEDVQNKVYLAGVRALGIVSKLITGPYFRLVGDTGHVLDLNPHLHQLQLSLQRFAEDSTPLMSGECAFGEDVVKVNKDDMYESLLRKTDDEFDILTQQILEVLCIVLMIVLEKQCQDQLPGGKYATVTDDLLLQGSSCPASNIVSERDFAVFDNLLHLKPSARVASLEALVMWVGNKPGEWLSSLPEDVSAAYHQDARKMVKEIKERMKKRRAGILELRKIRLAASKQKRLEEKEKKQQKKFAIAMKIQALGGPWTSKKIIERKLNDLDEKSKIDALYCQLQYHHIVLNSLAPEPYYFQKTHSFRGRKTEFNSTELTEHLLQIILLNLEKCKEKIDLDAVVEERDVELVFKIADAMKRGQATLKQKDSSIARLKESRLKRKSTKSKELIEKLPKDPELLLQKKIKHKTQETPEDIPEWYDGTVIRIEQLSKNVLRTKYEITYDIDGPDALFSFELINELKKGNFFSLD